MDHLFLDSDWLIDWYLFDWNFELIDLLCSSHTHTTHTQDYLAHIIDQCDLSIRPEQVCALFGNIEDIYEFNRWCSHDVIINKPACLLLLLRLSSWWLSPYNSELLQALDLCDLDPVAIARCFVMKVRKVGHVWLKTYHILFFILKNLSDYHKFNPSQ